MKKVLKIIPKIALPWKNLSKKNQRRLNIIAYVAIIIMIPVSLYILKHAGQASAAWFDTNFSFRQRVDITNPGSAQTDYQISFVFDTSTLIAAGKMQSNCNDIRITDTNGKLLPYWIDNRVNICNATNTKIWTKVPTIPTTGATLYVYYGNPSASSYQNGRNVFLFFDDFSTDTSSSYTDVASSGWTNSYDSTNKLLSQTNTAQAQHWAVNATYTLPTSYIYEGDVDITSDPPDRNHSGLATDFSSSAVTGYRLTHLDSSYYVSKWSAGTETAIGSFSDGGIYADNAWITNRVYRDRSGGTLKYEATNGTTTVNSSYNDTTNTTNYIGFHSYGSAVSYDNIRVRKYATAEPFVAYATGGTITQFNGYTIHTFTSSGTFTPNANLSLEYLVVGGGGGGGTAILNAYPGGGGGAGGFRTGTGLAVTSSTPYSVTVGGGGPPNTNGSDSIFSTITSTGGGKGLGTALAGNGGSGGGSVYCGSGCGYSVGTGNTPSTSPSQGNNGAMGNTAGSPVYGSGGGGGAGGVAPAYTSNVSGGNGGPGTASSISGASVTYAGGGGGGTYTTGAGSGGSGGGGAGGNGGVNGTSGTANTGGGGGGGGGTTQAGGSGGSGIVIVRYLQSPVNEENGPGPVGWWKLDEGTGTTANDSTATANGALTGFASATGGTVTYSGGYTIHTFTGNGTFTPTGNMTVEYLVVGGGGGGGGSFDVTANGGGGGGGAVRTGSGFSVSAQAYSVTVGGSGSAGAGSSGQYGGNGGDSTFSTITSNGGGGGATWPDANGVANGNASGGGAGGAGGSTKTGGAGGTYGNAGGSHTGTGTSNGSASAGGGGGAGGVGGNGVANAQGGAGGIGLASAISGSSVFYGGGGGGGAAVTGGGTGGTGGGGNGGALNSAGSAGTANTGGGGGGASNTTTGGGSHSGGAGGSGIVIIRYPTPGWRTQDHCVSGKCLFFDGVDDYVDVGTNSTFNISADLTLEAWYKTSDTSGTDHVILNKGTTNDWLYALYMTSNHISCKIYQANSSSAYLQATSTINVNDGKWHHAACTLSGTTLTLYDNGIQVATSSSTTGSRDTSSAGGLSIGRFNAASTLNWPGFIDDVKIYKYARSITQIKADFNKGAEVLGIATNTNLLNGAVGYWKMDENTATSAYDSSGNSNTNTLAAVPTTTTFTSYHDGYVNSGDPTYSTCRSGAGLFADPNQGNIGNRSPAWNGNSNWYCSEVFVAFDTSSIPDNATVTSATFSLYGNAPYNLDAADEARVRVRDYGTSVDTGDYVAGASLSSNTLVAHWTPGTWTQSGYNDFTNDALPANVSKTGDTRLMVHSKFLQDGTATHSYVSAYSSGAAAGTSQDPKLTATYTTAGADWTGTSKFGNGYDFESTNSEYSYAADSASLSITGSYTLSAWIKPESNTASTLFDIAGKWDGSNESYLMAQYGDEIRCYVDSSSNYVETNAANLATGTWYHVACAYDSVKQTVTIYVNGQISASTVTGTIPSSIGDDAGRFQIGAEDTSTTPANFYDGVIDEARVYNRAFSPAEVQQLYNFAPGPVVNWDFEEGSGTSTKDTSGNGYAGTLTNGPTWTTGKYGKAIDYDGSNDYTTQADNSAFSTTTKTLEAWVKMDTLGTNDLIAGKGAEYWISYNSNAALGCTASKFAFSVWNGSAWACANSTTTPITGVWYHLVGTYDGTNIRLYVNGVLEGGPTAQGAPSDNTYSLDVGGFSADTQYSTDAKIDSFKLYDYVRTPGQIVEDMNAGHPAPGSPIGSPVGYWKFDQGADNTCAGGTNDACNSGSAGSTLDGAESGMAVPATANSGWNQNGKFGKALSFDGSNDYVSVADNNALSPSSALTLSAWINPTAIGANIPVIFSKQTSGGGAGDYYLNISSTGGRFLINNTTLAFTYTFSTSRWYYIVGVYDASTTSMKVYINGTQIATTSSAPASMTNTTAPLYIGTDPNSITSTYSFNGLIDEAKIFSSALTSAQVKLDYNSGQSLVLGAMSDTSGLSGGNVASNSASAEYCIPGDTATCSAPVARWDFEEGTGSSANDTSGNNNTGTWQGTVPYWNSGKIGKAGKFNGSNNYLSLASPSNFNFSAPATISVWVKSTSDTAQSVFAVTESSTGNNYQIMYLGDVTGSCTNELITLSRAVGGVATYNLCYTTATRTELFDGRWHFISATFDGSTVKLYLDGIQKTLTVGVGSNNGAYGGISGANDASIGSIITSSSRGSYVNGSLDNLRVFNYARSAAQIQWDYNQGKPVGWWKFDECQGSTAGDSSGNGLSGTVTIGASGTQTSVGTCSTIGTARYNGVSGKYNYSLNLDGTDDYISVADNNILDLTTNYTLSAWIYQTSQATGGHRIIDKNTAGLSDGYEFDTYNGGTTNPKMRFCAGAACVNSNTVYSLNAWHHVAVVVSGTTASFYLDGKPDGSGTVGTTSTNALTLLIGAPHVGCAGACGLTEYFPGRIDEPEVFNYALTKQQIRNVMNQSGAVRYGPQSGTP